ncbi:hypothetical protein ACFYMX_13115 [Streptomyces griseofuscus]|uniref:hypothetical protein n=1 Tax=Streptomyces griseofuscus TaxID=146922 RepID=UPI0036C4BD9E
MARSRGVGRSVVGLVAGVVAVLVVGGPAEAGDTHWGAAPVVVAAVEPGDTHWGAVHDSGPVSLGDSSS